MRGGGYGKRLERRGPGEDGFKGWGRNTPAEECEGAGEGVAAGGCLSSAGTRGRGGEQQRDLESPQGGQDTPPRGEGGGASPEPDHTEEGQAEQGEGATMVCHPPPRGDSRVRGPGHRCKPAARKGSRPQNGAEGPAAAEPPSNPHQEDLQEAAPLSPSQGGG